jgi:hypothetical protein
MSNPDHDHRTPREKLVGRTSAAASAILSNRASAVAGSVPPFPLASPNNGCSGIRAYPVGLRRSDVPVAGSRRRRGPQANDGGHLRC